MKTIAELGRNSRERNRQREWQSHTIKSVELIYQRKRYIDFSGVAKGGEGQKGL